MFSLVSRGKVVKNFSLINVFYKFNVYMAQRILCAAVYPGALPCFVKGHLL